MPYSSTTLATFRDGVLQRLGDPSGVFWSLDEIRRYINEGLRTWQAFSGYWQTKGKFVTTPNERWYEFPLSLRDSANNTLLYYDLSDRDLIIDLQLSLIEPPTTDWTLPWAGTDQFSYSLLIDQLQQALDQFLRETGIIVTRSEIPVLAGVERVELERHVAEVVRCSWKGYEEDLSRFHQPLRSSNKLSVDSFADPLEPGLPSSYIVYMVPQPGVELFPVPNDTGGLEAITVNFSLPINPLDDPLVLRIPTDLGWILKWQALGCLLNSDGPSRDGERAKYCEARYADAMVVAKNYSSVLAARVNNYPTPVSPISSKDSFSPGWEGEEGAPREILMAGWNMIALSPTPVATVDDTPDGIYSIEFYVTRNAPVVVNDTDVIDLNGSLLGMLEDYVCHLALFKTGGAEWYKSMDAYKGLLETAMDYNSYLKSKARTLSIAKKRGTEEKTAANPQREDEMGVVMAGGGNNAS